MGKLKKLFKKVIKAFKTCFITGYYCFYFYHAKLKSSTAIFESRNGLDLAGNIFSLLKESANGNYNLRKIYLSVTKQTFEKAQAMLKNYNVNGVKIVYQGSFKYWKILATAKYIFTDTSLPRAYIKKDGQIYTNTWHGTPLKKMGKYNISERHSMGNIQRNLLFSDYLVFPNEYMIEKMLESYNIDTLFKGKVLCEGYPRNSIFLDESVEIKIRKELDFENKQLFVYMPTWKAENMGATMEASLEKLRFTLKKIDEKLADNQIMLLKLHPMVRANANLAGFKHIKSFPENSDAYEVLASCDTLITDYSSVFFDFAVSRKKIVLFTPDKDDYDAQRGFYFSLSELPFEKAETIDELICALNTPKNYDDKEFLNMFCPYDKKDAAEKILKTVLLGKNECKIYETKKSDKKKVLLYCGALLQNGITAAFKNLLGLINLDDREYYFAFKQSAFMNHPEKLDVIPQQVKLFSISSNIAYSITEAFAFLLFYKFNKTGKFIMKRVNRVYQREFKKHFTSFDMDYVVNFSGYDKVIIKLLEQFDAKKSIFVHSDMKMEISDKGNQHELTLKQAYRNYDKVAAVTKAMSKSIVEISGKKDNVVVVSNCFDSNRFIENAKKDVTFQKDTRSSIHHPGGINGILAENAVKFVSIGRYSPEKQHFMLIDAFDEYYKRNPNSYLIIIGGSGNLYSKTVRYANSKECSQNIACIWSVNNPMPIVSKCDLFILSSKYEALGLVLFEANIAGVPSICTEIEGPKEIINKYGGTMVKNSVEGILNGIEAFEKGDVKTMNIDFAEYNKQAIEQFDSLFD